MRAGPTRLWRLLDLVAREDQHLAGVTGRLFAGHKYVDDLAELAAALQRARELTRQLSQTHAAIRGYADEHLNRPPIRSG